MFILPDSRNTFINFLLEVNFYHFTGLQNFATHYYCIRIKTKDNPRLLFLKEPQAAVEAILAKWIYIYIYEKKKEIG